MYGITGKNDPDCVYVLFVIQILHFLSKHIDTSTANNRSAWYHADLFVLGGSDMLKRLISVGAAVAVAAVLSVSAFAANGGVVGNVVDAGENIVNDVVRAGENVVDDVTDAVTGDENGTGGAGNVGNGTGDTTTPPQTTTTTGTESRPEPEDSTTGEDDNIIDSAPRPNTNPGTGVPFAYGALAALAMGGAGMAVSFRKDD